MSHNTVIHCLVRPAVRIAAYTHVTPNQVTTLRLVTGMIAAFLFAQGSYGLVSCGGLVFFLSMLLDRADGELARQTNQMSLAGYRYDLISDCIASVAAFIGLGIGLMPTVGIGALWLGVFAGVGISALFFQLNVLKVASVNGYDLYGGRLTVDPDDAMIFVPVLVWLGLAPLLVLLAGVITPIAVLCVFGLWRRRAYSST